MSSGWIKGALAAAAALALASIGAAQAKPEPNICFYPNDWNGWKATPDARAIIVRVGVNKFYRLGFSNACPQLKYADAHLITQVRGSNMYCSPLDFDLRVSESGPGAIPVPCIVSSMTLLSPAEAAALPRNLKP